MVKSNCAVRTKAFKESKSYVPILRFPKDKVLSAEGSVEYLDLKVMERSCICIKHFQAKDVLTAIEDVFPAQDGHQGIIVSIQLV